MFELTPTRRPCRVKRTKGPKQPKLKIRPDKSDKLSVNPNVDDQLCRFALWTAALLVLMMFLRMLYLEYEREDSCLWNLAHRCWCERDCP